MDAVAIGTITGVMGLAMGVISTAFTLGGRYRGIIDDTNEITKRQNSMESRLKDCQNDEAQRIERFTTLFNQHTISMSTLATGISTLTATLLSVAKQSDITELTDRVSHVEGILNHK